MGLDAGTKTFNYMKTILVSIEEAKPGHCTVSIVPDDQKETDLENQMARTLLDGLKLALTSAAQKSNGAQVVEGADEFVKAALERARR